MPQDSAADSPESPCPTACDVAIPVVYWRRPIRIPADKVAARIPFEIDLRASMEATFTNPDSSPPISIARWSGSSPYVSGLGHAGIAMINGRTGAVAYWEYGRYDRAEFGEVRDVSDVASVTMTFDEAGNPERSALDRLALVLTKTNGPGQLYEGVYIKLANGSFDRMVEFAENRRDAVAEGPSGSAEIYSVESNHCFTFAMEVAAVAGVRTSAARNAPTLEVELIGGNMATRALIRSFSPVFEVPGRQMRALQQSYRAFNVSSDGAIDSSFQFPTALNAA